MYRSTWPLTPDGGLSSLFALLLLAACPGRQGTANDDSKRTPPAGTEGAEAKPSSAKLVLSVVLDQMPSDALLRYAPYLDVDGPLRRAIDSGLYHERVRYGYAGTNTAPGHTSIYTGELPADHGIDSNDVFDYGRDNKVKIIDDGKHSTFGVETFASPWRVLKPTVGDLLREQDADSKVVSVSLKARAAVVSGGQKADFVTWYDPKLPGFTTSAYYAEEMPPWLSAWNQANPVADRLTEWTAAKPELYQRLHGPDDAPGEANWYGLGTVFPHSAQSTERPNKTFLATPQSVDYLLDMARVLVDRYQLGQDDHPDLLAVSISSTDYAGHSFSWNSWEYLDVLLKADRALGNLVAELEDQTEIAVIITSDHGGTPLAETRVAQGLAGGRVVPEILLQKLEAHADKELGEGTWVHRYIQPYLYLSPEAMDGPRRDEVVALFSAYAGQLTELEGIYDPVQARGWRESEESIKRDVANTVAARTVALFVVPAEGYVAAPGEGDLGTGHGTPWDPDREVPVLAFGAGVTQQHNKQVEPQQRVAATVAALLGLPWHLPPRPLAGSPKPK